MAGRVAAANRVAATRIDSIGDLPNLKWWYEPDSIVATDAVDSLTDKSGSGNTLTSTGSNRPTLAVAALDGYNGIQVVRAASQRIEKTSATIITGTALTFGLVMKLGASLTDQQFLSTWDGNTGGADLLQNGTKYSVAYPGVIFQDANAVSTTGFHIFTYRVAGQSGGSYRYDRIRTAIATDVGFVKPIAASGAICLGCRNGHANHSTATFIAGFLCNGALTDGQIRAAEDIWKAKYPTLA